MKNIDIIEAQDITEMINAALQPWVQWSQEIFDRVTVLEKQHKRQAKQIAALEVRVAQLELDAVSGDTYSDTY